MQHLEKLHNTEHRGFHKKRDRIKTSCGRTCGEFVATRMPVEVGWIRSSCVSYVSMV